MMQANMKKKKNKLIINQTLQNFLDILLYIANMIIYK